MLGWSVRNKDIRKIFRVADGDGFIAGLACAAGDRYLLKLFRDFVLHQVQEDGTPVLDWGHVVECLNKLDAGVPEKVCGLGE